MTLTRDKLDELSEELWRRCRLPLDQVCEGRKVWGEGKSGSLN